MASDAFTIWDSQTFDTTGLTIEAGKPVILASSTPMNNGPTQRSSIVLEIEYETITPDITDGLPPFTIGAILEVEDANGNWKPIAYQFSPVRNSESPPTRIIRMQPDISDFNAGIDDSVFPVDREIARISRQQGFLPDTDFRVCILLVDNDPTGPNAFQSLTVSCTGERYDHV